MTFLISSIIRTMLNMTFLYGSVNFLSIWCSLLSFVVSALFGRHLGSRGVFMQRSSVIFYLLRLVANIVSYFLYKTNYIKMFTKYDMLQTFYLFDFVRVLCLTMLNISNKKLTITYPFEKGPLSLRFRGHLPTQLVANIVSYFLYKTNYIKMFTKYYMLQTFYLFDFVRVLCLTMLNISNKKLTITYPFEKGPLSLRFRGHLPTQLVANIVSYFLYKMHYLYSKICHVEPI
jgi:hypothetical protein